MKKYFLLAVVLFFATQIIYAQEGITKAISIGPELNIPQRSLYNIGYGVSANFEVPVASKVSVVAGGGLHRYSYKNFLIGSEGVKPSPDNYIPLKAGVKYYADTRLYLQGELGTVLSNSSNNSGNKNLFTYSLGTGFLLPLGESKSNMVDVGLRFEDWSENRLRQFAIRVAYRFGF